MGVQDRNHCKYIGQLSLSTLGTFCSNILVFDTHRSSTCQFNFLVDLFFPPWYLSSTSVLSITGTQHCLIDTSCPFRLNNLLTQKELLWPCGLRIERNCELLWRKNYSHCGVSVTQLSFTGWRWFHTVLYEGDNLGSYNLSFSRFLLFYFNSTGESRWVADQWARPLPSSSLWVPSFRLLSWGGESFPATT